MKSTYKYHEYIFFIAKKKNYDSNILPDTKYWCSFSGCKDSILKAVAYKKKSVFDNISQGIFWT